jgi:hypothetical protein
MKESCEQLLLCLEEPLTAEARAHLEGCAFCRGARAGYLAMAPSEGGSLSPERRAALQAAAAEEVKRRPRAAPWWVEALVLMAVNVAVAGAGSLWLGQGRIQNPAPPSMWGAVAGLLVTLIAAGAFLALAPRGKLLRNALLALGLGTLGVLTLAGAGGSDATEGFIQAGMPCATTELTLSLVPVAFAVWMLTRAAYDPLRALLVGLSGGAAGMLALHVHCSIGTASHLLLFHGLPWIATAMAALVIRSRLTSRSHAP